jgi:hypothetical protein
LCFTSRSGQRQGSSRLLWAAQGQCAHCTAPRDSSSSELDGCCCPAAVGCWPQTRTCWMRLLMICAFE